MTHDVRVIGNEIIRQCQKNEHSLSILSFLKYLFFVHGWHMGFYGLDNRLFKEEVEAWKHGPVVPKAYYAYRYYLSANKPLEGVPGDDQLSDKERNTIDFVLHWYSHLRPYELVDLTHAEGTPWYKYRDKHFEEIPASEIADYFQLNIERQNIKPDARRK